LLPGLFWQFLPIKPYKLTSAIILEIACNPAAQNSWKGETNQLAPVVTCRIISWGRFGKITHIIMRSKSFARF